LTGLPQPGYKAPAQPWTAKPAPPGLSPYQPNVPIGQTIVVTPPTAAKAGAKAGALPPPLGPGSTKAGAQAATGGIAAAALPYFQLANAALAGGGGGGVASPSYVSYQPLQAPQLNPNMLGISAARQALEDRLAASALAASRPDWSGAFATAEQQMGQAYGPYINSIMNQGAYGANALQGYTLGAMQDLRGLSGLVAQNYANAARTTNALGQGVARSLVELTPAQNAQMWQQPGSALATSGLSPATLAGMGAASQALAGGGAATLAGLSSLQAARLAQQGAAQTTYAQELPTVLARGGQQALAGYEQNVAGQVSKASLAEAAAVARLAPQYVAAGQRQATTFSSVLKGFQTVDSQTAQHNLDLAKANLTSIHATDAANLSASTRVNIANMNAGLAAQRIAVSQGSQKIAQGRLALAMGNAIQKAYGATGPGGFKATSSIAKTGIQAANAAAGMPHPETGVYLGKTVTAGGTMGKYGTVQRQTPTNFYSAVGSLAAALGNTPGAQLWAEGMIGTTINYGYGGGADGVQVGTADSRQLEPAWQQALHAAGLPSTYGVISGQNGISNGLPYLSPAQARTINNTDAAGAAFAHSLRPMTDAAGHPVYAITPLVSTRQTTLPVAG
jgi:hypothetical protein